MPDFLEALERGSWRPSRSQTRGPLVADDAPLDARIAASLEFAITIDFTSDNKTPNHVNAVVTRASVTAPAPALVPARAATPGPLADPAPGLADSHTPVTNHISAGDLALDDNPARVEDSSPATAPGQLTVSDRRNLRRKAAKARGRQAAKAKASRIQDASRVQGASRTQEALSFSKPRVASGHLQFLGTATIDTADDAVRAASAAEVAPDFSTINGSRSLHLVFYTDGSRTKAGKDGTAATKGGYAVIHKVPGTKRDWRMCAFLIENCYGAVQSELSAQTEALAMAVRYLERNDVSDAVVQIFTDSQESIKTINKGISKDRFTGSLSWDQARPILVEMAKLSERIHQRKSKVEIKWMPRNTTRKHEDADYLSGKASLRENIEISQPSTMTIDVEREVREVTERHLTQLAASASKSNGDHDAIKDAHQSRDDTSFLGSYQLVDPQTGAGTANEG
ncbi:hypothetical protein QBC37DRAFT_375728 [Rhypophila decipiens]|uniref:RNase H type-1 domain-containing protein n=1 Tax=Rhypophila decipiens TaxID=261697 RepID=A0AAN6Y5R5_9PEZI|nr:hypothetical protein QBC37DRAFT_375728 [Rhypophila decipiens]